MKEKEWLITNILSFLFQQFFQELSPGFGSNLGLLTSVSLYWFLIPLPTGAPGYSLAAGGGAYALSTQPSSLSMTQTVPVATSSLSSQSQNPYPTYISPQLGPVQISPSQNPYAAAATGHPLYPASHLAGLQVQQSQVVVKCRNFVSRVMQLLIGSWAMFFKSSLWLCTENCISTGVRKPGNT